MTDTVMKLNVVVVSLILFLDVHEPNQNEEAAVETIQETVVQTIQQSKSKQIPTSDDDNVESLSGVPESLTEHEQLFWDDVIDKYLKPLQKNVAQEKQMEDELIDLRNKCCLFYFLVNALLVTTIYALLHTDAFNQSLSINITCGSKYLSIEPISITFTVVFGILLAIQFVCLFFHRFSTLIHITATTEIREDYDKNEIIAGVLQRSGSSDSKMYVVTEDDSDSFQKKKMKRMRAEVIRRKDEDGIIMLDFGRLVEENLNKINKISEYDVIEGPGNEGESTASVDEILQKFGHLTKKEHKCMRNFIISNYDRKPRNSIEEIEHTSF